MRSQISGLLKIAGTTALTIVAIATIHAQSTITIFENGRVIVGDGKVIENASVVVDGTRITQVGPAASVKAPAGATRVSITGKTLMPTLVDAHVHTSTTRDALITDLKQRARMGIGAAMSLGLDPGDFAFQVRSENIPGAARFFTAGRGITAPEPGRTDVPYWITTADQARTAVRELAKNKVDIVKIWVDDRDHKYTKLSPALYAAVIDEAHKNKLRVTAHIFALEDAKGLLKAGIDGFAHGIRDTDADAEVMALFKSHPNVVLVPNMPDRGVAADYSWLKGIVADGELQKIQAGATNRPEVNKTWQIQARNLKKLSDAGVKIAMGTDGNTFWAPHTEIEDMVAAGMTPAQVIVAATKTSADWVRLPNTGTIENGKTADLLILDANPLDNITNTRKISAVYLRGAAVPR
jgi:imidazolonepropionase-like amidohydrolase